jgi:hypothetical protein
MATRFDVEPGRTFAIAWCGAATRTGSVRLALMMLACLPLAACGFYSADPITARVVDADTGTPLAGVNVVAAWRIEGGMNYGATVGYMNVMETVTDKDGNFDFPGWGPRPNMHFGKIFLEAPALMFYKAGYRFNAMGNRGGVSAKAPSHMASTWNHETIALKRLSASGAEHKASVSSFASEIYNLTSQGVVAEIAKARCVLAFQEDDLIPPNDSYGRFHVKELLASGAKCERE